MIELAYINTKHPDFRSDASIVSSLISAAGSDEEKQRNVPVRRALQPQQYEHDARVSIARVCFMSCMSHARALYLRATRPLGAAGRAWVLSAFSLG